MMGKVVHAIASCFSDSHVPTVHLDVPEPHIHRLPVELLQQIFLLVVNDVSDCPSIFALGPTTISVNFASVPLVFTRVCRNWRVVARSTTGLWSRIRVTLPGGAKSLTQFLPSLLQSWLACSGSRPLTLHIEWPPFSWAAGTTVHDRPRGPIMLLPSPADSRLLETLYFERMRWETVVCVSQRDWPGLKFDTPQLRTLECTRSDVIKFNAPNLRRLHIVNQWLPDISPIPTCKNIRHLHLQSASPKIIHSTSVTFSFLETIVVDVITQYPGAGSDSGDSAPHSCLESMTLPLSSNPTHWHRFIEVFDGLYLPMLQKLTLVGDPNPGVVGRIMAALAVAVSCNVRVVDFQTDTPLDEVDLDTVEPLLSVVREVSVHEGLLCCRAPCN